MKDGSIYTNIIPSCQSSSANDEEKTTKKRPAAAALLVTAAPALATTADGKNIREEKRRKWEAKQAQKKTTQEKEQSRALWINENAHFASLVTEADAAAVQRDHHRTKNTTPSSSSLLSSKLEDLLAPYVDIQDTIGNKLPKTVSTEKEDTSGKGEERLFIAEGTETIRLLIQQSTQERSDGLQPIQLKSIFVKPSILFDDPVHLRADIERVQTKRKETIHDPAAGPGFHVLVGSEASLSQVAGFQVSRGAMACGIIPKDCDVAWLETLIQSRMKTKQKKLRLLALDGICDTANLGSMVRCASAFGIDVIILSNDTCEAWYRRSIRVSMGHIFRVPVVRVPDLAALLNSWASRYPPDGLQSFAAVIDTDCLRLESLAHGKVPPAWCCVMGNESQGISKQVASACTHRIRIDMDEGVDSLSVPIACGILVHGLKEREAISTE